MVQYTPASDKLVHEVSVDFKKRMVSDRVHVVQYDNSMPIVAVSLYSDSATYTIPQNYEANIRVKKPDGKFVYNKALGCDSTKAILYFEITEQMTSKNGLLSPVIELRNGNCVAASGYFEIEVDRNPVQQGDIESTSEYTRIEDYVKEAGTYADNAKASASDAAKSASAASSSASAAKTSETNAKTSETNAKSSETKAKTSETNAKTSENNASTQATNAASSAAAAKTSETNAKSSETKAKASETASANLASAASTSATNAANSASAALASQNAAKTSENNAKTYETNADASATAAAQSATDASTSAINASNSANEALSSEASAAQSATEAAASAALAAEIAQKQLDVSDLTEVVNKLTHHRISQKITDSNDNYINDSNGGYLEFEALFVEPADLVPIFDRLSELETKLSPALTIIENLEKRLTNLENTAIQGVII